MTDLKQLTHRYVAVWNEPDAGARRAAIAALWSEDGTHRLEPPVEVRRAADALGVGAVLEVRGHDGLEERVRLAYEEFVEPGTYVFRGRDDVSRAGQLVKFHWEMVGAGGEVAAVGLELMFLDASGRIETDYQFIES